MKIFQLLLFFLAFVQAFGSNLSRDEKKKKNKKGEGQSQTSTLNKADQQKAVRLLLDAEKAKVTEDWETAAKAYAAAWQRWPESIGAEMGLGNSAYGRGDYAEAAEIYRRLLTQHPGFAPALNNLAQTMAKMGDFTAGERYAEEAIAAGGVQNKVYAETLQEIRDHIGQ